MADTIAITRAPNRQVVITQRRKILKALTLPKLAYQSKLLILKWLTTKQDVANGSAIKAALIEANALTHIW